MTYFTNHLPTALMLGFTAAFFSFFATTAAATDPMPSNYELSLSFVPETSQLSATAKITIEAGQKISFFISGLEITGTLLQSESGAKNKLLPVKDTLNLPVAATRQILSISYTKTVLPNSDNLISQEGISLTSNWHPVPSQPMRYQLTAELPDHFTAVLEADTFPLAQQGNTVSAVFSTPVTSLHFNAGPYTLDRQQVREGLMVYSMFFKEDQELAAGYLQAATEYLRHYEREIGPYPYTHYVIVANRLPTGYGMPTFTLLGQMVLRLPFIKDTSLGHEIVHSWFGNAVEVDYAQGNWCEGLTSFLADHSFREKRGEGASNRLESITRYLSYVHKESAIPLSAFTSASHNQPMAEARRAVGYDRGALFFYELREKIGRKQFTLGLQQFYADNIGKEASWQDVQKSFAAAAGENLDAFFSQRLTRNFIPALAVENISTETIDGTPTLFFDLLQLSDEPFSLVVPIRVTTTTSTMNVTSRVTERKTRIAVNSTEAPVEFTLDPEYTFLRQLNGAELPAVWSAFLGSHKQLIILGDEKDRPQYQALLEVLAKNHPTLTTAAQVTNQELSNNDLLFLGLDQAPSRALFALPEHRGQGFNLDVRRNPLNVDRVAVLVASSDQEQTRSVARRLGHYGKYSSLEFSNGRNTLKKIHPTSFGLRSSVERLPAGSATSALSPFAGIIEKLADAKVVYVGETHTSLADHQLQLRIIQALHKKNPRLAIGMEMFPASAQPALDRYTRSDQAIDERTFLKESEYYKVWRFDYRYYQDILNYARHNHLPVIGLNLDRQIVSEVFRSGGTDTLTQEVQASLPKDRDLDMPGYRERLAEIYGAHIEGSHGSGAASGFIQAQGLWDETMAENITTYLTSHPEYKMVVLAGTQHTRKDSGIPPRVARRISVPQASIINITEESAPANLAEVADYYFLADSLVLPESPKIGIVLEEQTEDKRSFLKISGLSPHGKAAAAGLLEADIVTEINGFTVADMADLHIAMHNTTVGQTIDVRVQRAEKGQNREIVVPVELTVPPSSRPHP